MATTIRHRKVNIVVLDNGEDIASHCHAKDIAIIIAKDGWWLHFIDGKGNVESYDRPYPSYNAALWAAKAAAEFGFD